ncbi:MAG: TonB-dependent receptor domain-containing protein [Campylobacter sp.]
MSKINHKFTLSMALCAQILTINLNAQQMIAQTGAIAAQAQKQATSQISTNTPAKSVTLNSISVIANKDATDAPFLKPGAKSARADFRSNSQSIDSIVRSVSGAYTQIDQAQGTLSVNLRSMSGLGRVDTKIDGIKQTAYTTASDGGGFHDSIGTSSYGAMIDKNFLTSAEFELGTFSSGGAGLMGSANFHTISINDIIENNRQSGAIIKHSFGTNGIGPSSMIGVAARANLDENSDGKFNENSTNSDKTIGFLYGFSHSKITQNYRTGDGSRIDDPRDFIKPDGKKKTPRAPINPQNLKQRPQSHIAKIELNLGAFDSVAQYRTYKNTLAGRKMQNNTYQIEANFNPTNPLINTKFSGAISQNLQKYLDKEKWAYMPMDGIKTKNNSTQIDISNTAEFRCVDSGLEEISNNYGANFGAKITFGANYFRNDYKTNGNFYENLKKFYLPYAANSFYPQGKQDTKSLYLNTEFDFGRANLETNFDYTFAKLSGFHNIFSQIDNNANMLYTQENITRRYNYPNLSATFSLKLDPLFSPFFTYSRTHRMPNPQEFFFTHSTSAGGEINRDLRAESADTFGIGFNAYKHGNFFEDDIFGLKFTFFRSKVSDYIYNRYWKKGYYLRWINDDEKANFRGFEIESKYDAGFAYANLNYSYQKSQHKFADTQAVEFGGAYFGQTQFAKLPQHSAVLDIGARFFDEKLNLGAISKYTSHAKRITPANSLKDDANTPDALMKRKTDNKIPQIPTIIDLYANYQTPLRGLSVRAQVQNLLNKNYMDALYTYNSTEMTQNIGSVSEPIFIFNNSARGRTFVVNFEYKY